MRSSNSTMSTTTHLWSSPLPYLFGGLGLMLTLIAVALVILACSNKKRSPSRTEAGDGPVKLAIQPLDTEPRIVVIMAGDEKPSFLATPVTALAPHHQFPVCCCDDKV